jgi:predicted PurR-regulated permease PerM
MTQLRTANAIALFTAIGFYIIGIKAAFLLAILTGVLHIIPHVGLPLAATVSVFVAAIQSPFNANGDLLFTIPLNPTARIILTGLIQVIIWIIYKLFLKKFFIHERIHLDPLLNIVLILVAAKLFGVMGMLFIIPIYFVYRMVLKEFYLALSEKET